MGSVFPLLDILAVALRIYAKRKIRRFGIDDWLIIVSLVIFSMLNPGTTLPLILDQVLNHGTWGNVDSRYVRKAHFGRLRAETGGSVGPALDSFGKASPTYDSGAEEDDHILVFAKKAGGFRKTWAGGRISLTI